MSWGGVEFYLEKDLLDRINPKNLLPEFDSRCVIFFDGNNNISKCIFSNRRSGYYHKQLSELLVATSGKDDNGLCCFVILEIWTEKSLAEVQFSDFNGSGNYKGSISDLPLILEYSNPLKYFLQEICAVEFIEFHFRNVI